MDSTWAETKKEHRLCGAWKVEHTGLEPVTSTLPAWRAPSCANAPMDSVYHIIKKMQ